MVRALEGLAAGIDALNERVFRAAVWLYPVLVAVLLANVVLRYGFGRGFIELEELQWHLYAAAFLLGFAGVHARDAHVRVDILRARFSPRLRAWVELLGSLLLLLPFCVIVADAAWDFALRSWQMGERSAMPSGLPARYVIKAVLFVAISLLGLQAVSVALRQALFLAAPERRDP